MSGLSRAQAQMLLRCRNGLPTQEANDLTMRALLYKDLVQIAYADHSGLPFLVLNERGRSTIAKAEAMVPGPGT